MIIDHIGVFFLFDIESLRALGRLAFPIFFFLIGYSKDFKPRWNLLLLGTIITIFWSLTLKTWVPLDILVTAFLVKIAMQRIEKKNWDKFSNLLSLFVILTIWSLPTAFISYGTISIMFAICGSLKRTGTTEEQKKLCNYFILFSVIFDFAFQSFFSSFGNNFVIVFFFISAALWFILSNFKMKEFDIKNNLIRKTILFISRNSLLVYCTHLVLFIYLSAILFPDHYAAGH